MTTDAKKMIVNARVMEVFRLIPHQATHIAERRQTIIRKLHDERHGIAFESRALENQRHKYAHGHAHHVQQHHHKRCMVGEKHRRKQGVYRKLR